MCIAILNTKKAGRLPSEQIKNSWDNNDMGSGLLWNENGKLSVFKTYKYDEYINKYNELRDNKKIGNIILHFRIATSGVFGEHNLHPFLLDKDLGFVHNGVISGLGNKDFSDTYEFNDMLKRFKHDFLNCEMTKHFISEYIGYSKLIFLDSNDRYTIINEDLGKWTDNNWYSNDSYKSYNNYVYYGNKKVSKNDKEDSTTKYSFDLDDDWIVSDNNYNNSVSTVDEYDMYVYLCDIYGIDPEDDESMDEIDAMIELNNCFDLEDLYLMVSDVQGCFKHDNDNVQF